MKIIDLNINDFDEYSRNHKYGSFYQSSEYGKVMETTGFKAYYIGLLDDDGDLVGASLILTKKLYSSFKFAYAPRGFLIDYNDPMALKLWTLHMKKYFKRKNVVFIKVDPPIVNVERNIDGKIKYNGVNNKSIVNNLLKLDYIHMGYNNDFKMLKPRWNMVIKEDDIRTLYSKLSDDLKYKIYSSESKGIEVFEGDITNISDFYNFVKDKHTRKLNYYQNYYQILKNKNMFSIYFAKIDPVKFIQAVRNELSDATEKSEKYNEDIRNNPQNKDEYITLKMESDKAITRLNKELVLATNILKEHPNGTFIAASAVIRWNKQLLFLIDGINPKYKLFSPNHYLKWKIIEAHMNKGYNYINLNGISGEFNEKSKYYGLYEFKKSFGPNVVEYIGEFNLVINKTKYFVSKRIFNLKNKFNKEKQEKNTF